MPPETDDRTCDGLVDLLNTRHPDGVDADWHRTRDALLAAFDCGAAVSPIDLLIGGDACLPLWAEMCTALIPDGWHPVVAWDGAAGTPVLLLLPPGKTESDYAKCGTAWVTVEAFGDGTVKVLRGWPLPPDADYADASHDTAAAAVEAIRG